VRDTRRVAMSDLGVWEIVLRLGVGALLGGAVGLEREYAGQDAGFRTHLLLSVGAALFGVISVGAFDDFITDGGSNNVTVDVSRIASYVAPGVGFIGGGAILKHRGTVRGITTATSLWTAAAVGLASGVGFWIAAAVATTIALVALAVLKPLSNWVDARRHAPATLVVEVNPSGDGAAVLSEIQTLALPPIKVTRLTPDEGGSLTLTIEFWTRPAQPVIDQLNAMLSTGRDDIADVSFIV
jgi:putative Mg2+ transporter-C (MgtC) family protein